MLTKKLLIGLLLLLSSLNPLGLWGQELLPAVRKSLGKASHPALNELSGIISSGIYPGKYWVHNDSGDEARIFLIDSLAKLNHEFRLAGVHARDVEDIAWVKIDGKNYIVLADIGDNQAKRQDISLYVFEEPVLRQKLDTIPASAIRSIRLQYPDKARDAEAIFVDPLDQQFYLISKRDFHSAVYTAAIFQEAKTSFRLHKVMELPFNFITAADMASDGSGILMKNLTQVYYWPRLAQEPLPSALKKPYFKVAYSAEPQGEAIAFDRADSSFVTISERPFGLDAYLYQYKFTKP